MDRIIYDSGKESNDRKQTANKRQASGFPLPAVLLCLSVYKSWYQFDEIRPKILTISAKVYIISLSETKVSKRKEIEL